jgi:hypothetical protein
MFLVIQVADGKRREVSWRRTLGEAKAECHRHATQHPMVAYEIYELRRIE